MVRLVIFCVVASFGAATVAATAHSGSAGTVWAVPATTLVTILICLNLIGDGINTALNPTTTRR